MPTQPRDLLLKYQEDIYPIGDKYQQPINIYNYENATRLDDITQYAFLYVILNKTNLLYKIGITNNIRNRFRQLKNQSGCNLHLVFNISFECMYDESNTIAESYLHNYFKDKKHIGEWFNLSPRDLVQIRRWATETLEIDYYPIKNVSNFLI